MSHAPNIWCHALCALTVLCASAVSAQEPKKGLTEFADERSTAELHKAAEVGDVRAMTVLGWRYSKNVKVEEQSDQKAAAWWSKAAEKDNSQAMYNLGLLHREGRGVRKDQAQALAWLRKAATNAS